jgi:acyl-CoA synthetase (AMP-forming)/AMP-acid ligase II
VAAGRSVLIARDQYAAALALIELDGIARRLILCPPDLAAEHLPGVVAKAGVDAIVSEHDRGDHESAFSLHHSGVSTQTEWVILTSGTTGAPKLLAHDLASLTAPIRGALGQGTDVVWGTFYDIRRYGGLQIFFRALLGRGSLVLSGPGESTADYLVRLGAHGATHVSGTPSHWRRALMSPSARDRTTLHSPCREKSPTRDPQRSPLVHPGRHQPCVRLDGSRRGIRSHRWPRGFRRA